MVCRLRYCAARFIDAGDAADALAVDNRCVVDCVGYRSLVVTDDSADRAFAYRPGNRARITGCRAYRHVLHRTRIQSGHRTDIILIVVCDADIRKRNILHGAARTDRSKESGRAFCRHGRLRQSADRIAEPIEIAEELCGGRTNRHEVLNGAEVDIICEEVIAVNARRRFCRPILCRRYLVRGRTGERLKFRRIMHEHIFLILAGVQERRRLRLKLLV